MKQRGRKSAASLSVVTPLTAVRRPEPPEAEALGAFEITEWRAIVDRMPADHFGRETHGLLAGLCRHVVAARRIAASVQILERALGAEVDAGRQPVEVICESAGALDRLLRMRDREMRAASSLATRLRLTPQSSRAPRVVPPVRTGTPPWER